MAPMKNLYTSAGCKPGRGATRGSRGSRTRASTRGTIIVVEDSTASTQPQQVPPCELQVASSAPISVPQAQVITAPPTTAPQAPPTTAPQAPPTTAPQAPPTTAPQAPPTTAPHAPPKTAPQAALPSAPHFGPMFAKPDSKRTWRRLLTQEAITKQLEYDVKGLKEEVEQLKKKLGEQEVEQLKKKLGEQEKENENKTKTAPLPMPVYYGYPYHPYTRPQPQQHVLPATPQMDMSSYQPVPASYTPIAPPQVDHVLQPLQHNQLQYLPTSTQHPSTYSQYQYNQ